MGDLERQNCSQTWLKEIMWQCTWDDLKTTVFWDVAPWSLVEVYRRFRGACCLYHHHHPHDYYPSSSYLRCSQKEIMWQCTWDDLKTTVFWDVAPWSLVEVYRRFRGACCLYHHHHPHDYLHPRLTYIVPSSTMFSNNLNLYYSLSRVIRRGNQFHVISLSKQFLADQHTGEIWGYHGSEDGDVVLRGYDTV
jgi:hypothetical protein